MPHNTKCKSRRYRRCNCKSIKYGKRKSHKNRTRRHKMKGG